MRHRVAGRPRFRIALSAITFASAVAVVGAAYGPLGSSTNPTGAGRDAAPVAAPGTHAAQLGRGEVHRQLRALENSYQGRIGLYAIDTGTGKSISYRGHERFPMLSTFKAFAAAAILHKARNIEPGLMDKLIRYTEKDLSEHSPITKDHVATGMTVAQLCDAAVRYSDNTAANLLLKELGGPAGLTHFFRSIGDPISRMDRYEPEMTQWRPGEKRDTSTAVWMGRDLRAVTVGTALDPRDRAQLIDWLRRNATGLNRIRVGLPATWIVGNRTGGAASIGAAHDIAIAWPSPTTPPLIIAIYTHRRIPGGFDESVIARTATIAAQGLGKLP